MKTEGEIGVTHNKPRDAKDCYPPPEASREAWNRLSQSFRRNNSASWPVFWTSQLHTEGEQVSIILSQPVCGILLCSPRKLIYFVYSVNSDKADINLFYVSLGKHSYNISIRKRYTSKLEKGPYKVYFELHFKNSDYVIFFQKNLIKEDPVTYRMNS